MTTTHPVAPAPAAPQAPARRSPAWLIGAAALVTLVSLGVGVLLLGRDTASSAPYTDPAAAGRLTLCDGSGNAVTSGSINDAPFVARIAGPGQTDTDASATVFAVQPRQGVDPQLWNSLQLGLDTPVSAGHQASVELTSRSTTLAQFVAGYPAQWDGFVQLRLVTTTAATGTAATYPSVDLVIDGTTWTASDPGDPGLC